MKDFNKKLKSGFGELSALIIVVPTFCGQLIKSLIMAFKDHFQEKRREKKNEEKLDLSGIDNKQRHES